MSSTRSQRSATSERPVSSQRIADWIRDRIRLGQFVPGQRLVESDIIDALRASRSKVREALQRLEAEGLVTIEEFRGASVKRVGWDEVHQIYRARMALEGLAAAEFAAADAPEFKSELQQLQREMNQWKRRGGHEQFAKLNNAWHALIIKGSGNVYVGEFLARLTVPIYRLLFSTFYTAERVDSANADHKKITAAIVAGQADRAEQAMRDHVSHGLAVLSEINAQFVE